MTTPVVIATLLDAVNEVLDACRIEQIEDIAEATDGTNEDAEAALSAVDFAAREFQHSGWFFNTENDVTISPDGSGYLNIPTNALSISKARYKTTRNQRLANRGTRLYDPYNHTYVFTEDAVCDIIYLLPFEEMPSAMRSYVAAAAARRFGIPRLPTGSTFRYTEEALRSALKLAHEEDERQRNEYAAGSSPHFARHAQR